MISRKFGLTPHCAWKRNGSNWLKIPAITAPQYDQGAPVSGSGTPWAMENPASGRMSSLGMGMAALSTAIARTTPR